MKKKLVVGLAAIPVAVAAYRLLKRSAPVSETEASELEADAAAASDVVEAAPADEAVIGPNAPIEIAVDDFPVAEPAPVVEAKAPIEIAVDEFPVAEPAPAKAHHPKKKRARKRANRSGARPRHG